MKDPRKPLRTRIAGGFEAIPGSLIAYWVDRLVGVAFSGDPKVSNRLDIGLGVRSENNDRFQHCAWEIAHEEACLNPRSSNKMHTSRAKWFANNKGDGYRRWFGNNYRVVNWENDRREIKSFTGSDAQTRQDILSGSATPA